MRQVPKGKGQVPQKQRLKAKGEGEGEGEDCRLPDGPKNSYGGGG